MAALSIIARRAFSLAAPRAARSEATHAIHANKVLTSNQFHRVSSQQKIAESDRMILHDTYRNNRST
jgi:hypothetical protein